MKALSVRSQESCAPIKQEQQEIIENLNDYQEVVEDELVEKEKPPE